MQTNMNWADVGGFMVDSAIIFYVGEVAVLVGAAFGAASSMTARERAGRPLVAWEPVVCGVGGAVLGGIATIVGTNLLVGFTWSLLDAFSWYLFFAAGQGALIGLWVALYRTVGLPPSSPPSDGKATGKQRSIAVREH